jgi:hypothetical protein
MKRPWQKSDRAPGNSAPETSENYIPMTAHGFAKPGDQKRFVNPKPAKTSKLTPAKDKPRVAQTVRNRGPGSRLKSKRVGRS